MNDISNKGAATSKSFWNTVKRFITNKSIQINEDITIEVEKNGQLEVKGIHEKVDVRTRNLIKDAKILDEMFNKHYINIAEETPGIAQKF